MINNIQFSNLERPDILTRLADEVFDLVVIGGGITGGGIALDAAARGLKVALVEKGDFTSGTSSRSTKLIHGGLRYLKQFDFWLVKEVGSERAIVHRLAPHLVIPEKMLLPLIEHGSYGKWLTSIGLRIYDILAQVSQDDKRKMLQKKEALKLEPLLYKKTLLGAGYYAEYRTDDARLTLEIIKTSLQYGTVAVNYVEVTEFLYTDKKVDGVRVRDHIGDQEFTIRAKNVVSASGPWVDDLRELDHSNKGKRLHLTKGVHLVFPHKKLPVKQSIYFDIPDGRMMFAIPRGKITYIGTTDTNFVEDKEHVKTDTTDALYLINAVNNMFPSVELGLKDIVSSWAGLRPLIHEDGKSVSELSRKDEVFTSESGLISIAGGKLTGYRKMAERVVNRIAKRMEEQGVEVKACTTDKIPLCGSDFIKYRHVKNYIGKVHERLLPEGFSKQDAWYLVTSYGKQTETILEYYAQQKEDDHKVAMAKAELRFAINFEMIHTPMDFFIRRTGRMYFDIESVKRLMEPVLEEFKAIFNLEDKIIDSYRKALQAAIKEHSDFSADRE